MIISPDSIDSVVENRAAEAPKPAEPAAAGPVSPVASAAQPAAAQPAPEAPPVSASAPTSELKPADPPAAAKAEAQRTIPEVKPEARRPSASLIPFMAPAGSSGGSPGARLWRVAADRRVQAGGLAAALALTAVIAVASVSNGDQKVRLLQAQAGLLQTQAVQNRTLEDALKAMKTRLAALEAARREEAADLRKTGAEVRSGLAGARDANTTLAQLSGRLDRLEHDADSRIEKLSERFDHDSAARSADFSSRIEKLGDRLDHDSATHNADFTARIEKIEKKLAAPVVASLAPPAVAPPARPANAPPAFGANVSHETTGSITPVRPPIHGWVIRDAQDGVAIVEGPYGYRQVTAGEYLPGAGRVQRIERHGGEWQVVTSQGTIGSAMDGNF
jgi:hypothetical protein